MPGPRISRGRDRRRVRPASSGFRETPGFMCRRRNSNMQSLLDPLAELRNRVANAGLGRLPGLWASRAPLHKGPMVRIRLSPAASRARTSARLTVPPGRSRHLSSQTPSMRQLLKMLFSMSASRGDASRGSRTRPTARNSAITRGWPIRRPPPRPVRDPAYP